MNFRLRQERNAFVFLVVVFTPLVLLTAPLPYLLMSSERDTGTSGLHRTLDDASSVAQSFAHADRNRDGFIDADEAGAIPGLLPIFALVDADGDGRIDRGELTKVRPAR